MILAKKGYVPWKHTEEAKKKIGEGHIGNIHTEEAKQKQSVSMKKRYADGLVPWNKDNPEASKRMMGAGNPMYGKPSPMKGKHRTFTEEWKSNISKGKTGVKLSKEHSRKIALANTGEKHHMYGKHHPEETRRKIGEGNTGKKMSEEAKQKISEANKGEKNAFFGKTHTEESKKKISDNTLLQKAGPWMDTWGEKELGNILTANEIQFKKQKYFSLARHRVDIFIEPNICIEVDGDYFHGNPYPYPFQSSIHPGHKPDEILRGGKTVKEKWERDRRQTEALEQQGNAVLRFWQSELETEPEKCLQKIIKIIKESRR